MTIEERARRLVDDMSWVTEHLNEFTRCDLLKQIGTSMQAAIEEERERAKTIYREGTMTIEERARKLVANLVGDILLMKDLSWGQLADISKRIAVSMQFAVEEERKACLAILEECMLFAHNAGEDIRCAGRAANKIRDRK